MTATTKRCRKCDQVKPLKEFYPHAKYADGLDNRCRTCVNKIPKSEAQKLELRIKSRAYNRATAQLKVEFTERYDQLVAEALVVVRAEAEQLGPNARLKTGAGRDGETVLDRIRELCDDCGTSHERGHVCPHCGASPEHGPTKGIAPRRAPELDHRRTREQRLAEINAQIMRDRDKKRAAL